MATTTIRVPIELRDRLAERAAAHNTSLAEAIAHALEAEERAAFWAEAQATMGGRNIAAIRVDTAALAGTMKDGLDPDERWDDVL